MVEPLEESVRRSFLPVDDECGRPASTTGRRQWLPQMFSDSVIYGFGNVASRFVGLILVPLYTRVFSPAEYGLLDVLLASSIVLYILAESQIVSAVGRSFFEAREQGTLPVLLGTATRLYLFFTLLWSALTALLFVVLRPLLPSTIGWIHIAPIVLILFPQQMFALLQLVLRYERRVGIYIGFTIADVVTSGIGSAVAIFVFHSGIAGVLWALVFSKVLWGSCLVIKMRAMISWKANRDYAKEMLAYGIPVVPSVLTKWGQNYANRYVLAIQLSLSQLGLFSLAVQVAGAVAMVDSAFRQAWDPRAMQLFASQDSEAFFARTLHMYLAGMFLMCSGVALFAIPIVGILAGARFAAATPIVGFLVFGQMWNGTAHILASGNAWARRTYWNAIAYGSGSVVNVVALVVLAPRWGVLAGGVTYLAGAVIAAWIVLITAQRSHHIPYAIPMLALATLASGSVACGTYYYARGSMPAGFSLSRAAYSVGTWLGLACIVVGVAALRTIGSRSGSWFRPSSYWST